MNRKHVTRLSFKFRQYITIKSAKDFHGLLAAHKASNVSVDLLIWPLHNCKMLMCFILAEESGGERNLQSAFPAMWRPMAAAAAAANSRLLHFPYSSHLHDRSVYSAMYNNLLGLASTNATLPTFTFNPFTSGSLTSGSSLSAASQLLYGNSSAHAPPDSPPSSGNVYNSSLYGQRYHPYLSGVGGSSSSSQIKRLDSSVLH